MSQLTDDIRQWMNQGLDWLSGIPGKGKPNTYNKKPIQLIWETSTGRMQGPDGNFYEIRLCRYQINEEINNYQCVCAIWGRDNTLESIRNNNQLDAFVNEVEQYLLNKSGDYVDKFNYHHRTFSIS